VIDRKSELEVVVMNYAVEMQVVQQCEEEEEGEKKRERYGWAVIFARE
jgi:hypothetical protein